LTQKKQKTTKLSRTINATTKKRSIKAKKSFLCCVFILYIKKATKMGNND